MADTLRLVHELSRELCDKMAELDGLVADFQRDMLHDFERFMEDRLANVPGDVSRDVSRRVAASMSNYPSLNPNPCQARRAQETPDSRIDSSPPADPNPRRWKGKGRCSPPPTLPHTSGTPRDLPLRNPHARDHEFHGVFTPGFLPLFESGDGAQSSSSVSPLPTIKASVPKPIPRVTSPRVAAAGQFTSPEGVVDGQESQDKDAEDMDMGEGSSQRENTRLTPTPSRRSTNLSTSSAESTGSNDNKRRGGLRRNSSSTKGSPRRVRFEFQGREVLPSSSPQPPSAMVEHIEHQADATADSSAIEVDHDSYSVSSLLDVEGEEDSLPKPKKVSSTQALQALTRSPLADDDTVWRVVNGDAADTMAETHEPQGSHEAPTVNGGGLLMHDLPKQAPPAQSTISTATSTKQRLKTRAESKGKQPERLHGYESNFHHPEDKDSDNDEFLSIKPKARSSRKLYGTAGNSSSPKPACPSRHKHDTETEPPDDFFQYEGEGAQAPSQTKYLPEDEDEDVEEEGPADMDMDQSTSSVVGSRQIPRASPSGTPPSQSLLSRSMGSYKGQPFVFSPVRDSHLYEEIAGMDVPDHFVGSIDGRSGAEAADMNSYRASFGDGATLSTTPRSFSERFALEEAIKSGKVNPAEGPTTAATATFGPALPDVEEESELEGVNEHSDMALQQFGPIEGIDHVPRQTVPVDVQGASGAVERHGRDIEEDKAAKRDAENQDHAAAADQL